MAILPPETGIAMTEGTRGIDHVGITVPDLEAATEYFAAVFAAETEQEVWAKSAKPAKGERVEQSLGLPSGAEMRAARMLRLPEGPRIELFEYWAPEQAPPLSPSDFGLQHLAIFVDDMDGACRRIEENGGELMSGPHRMPDPDCGPDDRYRYTRAPWGTTIELVSYRR
jgi:catechol 2,3-dioxygenase-like lactoylglutathione lyase family enzyme